MAHDIHIKCHKSDQLNVTNLIKQKSSSDDVHVACAVQVPLLKKLRELPTINN